MTDTIITVDNLGKKYLIGHQQKKERYVALRDVIANGVKSLGKTLLNSIPSTSLRKGEKIQNSKEEFWALKEVSFEVKQGEVIGIIGRNGAGKSTLLKILSRITEPTTGQVKLKGRVASLLEVGTGFHPELTGRENIYLNGSILGMTKVEIQKKFDEIVDFAEVEKFLDTPVKRYSSGMYVRLAFAVAAHLEPEILVVDEVLAVGDAAFQKKCLGKMGDVANKEGRTVLFVSHNMATIQNLCQRGILLSQGHLLSKDNISNVIEHYLQESTAWSNISLDKRNDRKGTGNIRFQSITFLNIKGELTDLVCSGQTIRLILSFINHTQQDLKNLHIAIGINNQLGDRITVLSSEIIYENFSNLSKNINKIEIELKRLPLTAGRYSLTLYSTINGVIADWIQNAIFFDVEAGDYYKTGKIPPSDQGNFLMDYHFSYVN